MGRIPVRFQRVAAAFDSNEVARVRLCESSGSEHSLESSTDLSDLVKSFMEKNGRVVAEGELEGEDDAVFVHDKDHKEELEWHDSEKMEMLLEIFADDCDAKEKIRREAELAFGLVGDTSSPGFKRLLMSRLRERGFDAGNRYIVEISLAAEFEIARPTNQYSSLLDVFPIVFVGKVEELKRVVRLMCTAINDSMKSMDLHLPPWRRNSYMQAKWFNSYKRTTSEVSTRKPIGFEARPVKSYNCRDDYGRKTGFRVGYLTTAFNANGIGM